jgi:hypothetical protein
VCPAALVVGQLSRRPEALLTHDAVVLLLLLFLGIRLLDATNGVATPAARSGSVLACAQLLISQLNELHALQPMACWHPCLAVRCDCFAVLHPLRLLVHCRPARLLLAHRCLRSAAATDQNNPWQASNLPATQTHRAETASPSKQHTG